MASSPQKANDPPSGTTGSASRVVREVSQVTLHFLQEELLKYTCETRLKSGTGPTTRRPETKQKHTTTEGGGSPKSPPPHETAGPEIHLTRLEEAGFTIGLRLVERLVLSRPRFWDQRECVKFICKDLWSMLFQKQADRLQTNRKVRYRSSSTDGCLW